MIRILASLAGLSAVRAVTYEFAPSTHGAFIVRLLHDIPLSVDKSIFTPPEPAPAEFHAIAIGVPIFTASPWNGYVIAIPAIVKVLSEISP